MTYDLVLEFLPTHTHTNTRSHFGHLATGSTLQPIEAFCGHVTATDMDAVNNRHIPCKIRLELAILDLRFASDFHTEKISSVQSTF